MNSIKKIRTSLGYTQERFASLLHVSRTTVAMWETGKSEPGYETIRLLSTLFNISADFIIQAGVFEHWDDVVTYFDSVNYKLDQLIPPGLKMPTFCEDKNLTAWLDQTLYDNDELQVARWFSFAVKQIKIYPDEDTPDGIRSADVDVEFTAEFNALINDYLHRAQNNQVHPKVLTLQDAFDSFLSRSDTQGEESIPSEEGATLTTKGTSIGMIIPILGSIPAGIPVEAVEDILDWEEIPAAWAAGGREYFGLKVKGDSMYPKYLDGDTVILRKQESCDSGDDCAVMVNGNDSTLKQVFLCEDGGIEIRPLNPSYPPTTYTAEDVVSLPVSIAGVVVELRRKIK